MKLLYFLFCFLWCVNFIKFYSEIDRKDLAVQMRKRVGDYSRVVDLLRTGGGKLKRAKKEAFSLIVKWCMIN